MAISICFITMALLLYSLSIWSEKIKHQLKHWMIVTFIFAFICDLIGTSIMGLQTNGAKLHTHGAFGYIALVIMGFHLAWAIKAFKTDGTSAKLFHRFSVYAWFIWLIALFTGIPR